VKRLFLLFAMSALVFGQQGAQPQETSSATIRTTANEVLVDVVVRDKKGRPVRGLTRADFQIEEDGNPQRITAFREVTRQAGEQVEQRMAGRNSEPAPSRVDTTRQIRLVSLVFDRLGIDGRRLAKQAALDMLKTEASPNTFYAVFSIDLSLKVIQPFTDDVSALRRAVEKATSGTPSSFENDNAALKNAAGATSGSEGASDVQMGSRGPAEPINGAAMANEQMNRMIQDMLAFSENASREQQGRASLFSLLSIVQEQHRFPGRKSVLFFAEGLEVPNSMYEQFHSIISAANRANVSVYSVDAHGLRVSGDNGAAEEALSGAARSSRSQWKTRSGANPVTRDQIMALDRAADSLRANKQTSMAELAEGTGGFLMANTNDLRVLLKRASEDLNSYYEISYVPADPAYDGKFRKISVKVNKPDTHIQARSGYFSLPPLEGQAVYPHEVPLLKAVAERPLPRGIDYRASFLKFKAEPTQLQTVLAFDVPLKNITFARDKERNLYRTHVSLLVLLKDATGRVLKKYSRDVPFEGSLDKLEAFQQGHFIYTRPMILPVGRMTLETAVLDQQGQRVSAARSAYFAAGTGPALGLSAVTLIRRVEPMSEAPDPEDPLQFKGGKITPSLGETVRTGKGAMLPLYFIVYPAPGAAEKPVLTMEFLKDGQLVASGTPDLPPPNEAGVIPYIAETPIESFPGGEYEVRVTVKQGSATAQERMVLHLE
jgi:VWFA-related protein